MKDKKFAFCISESDLDSIRAKAGQAKMTVTDYLVACALCKNIKVVDGLPEVTYQLKAVVRNLNRLTTLANMGRITSVRLDEALVLFGKIYEMLLQIAGRKN